MSKITAEETRWVAVRMKRPQNPNRRTSVVEAEYRVVRCKSGKLAKRRIAKTGKRVFVAEHILRKSGFEVFMPKRQVWQRVNRISTEQRLVDQPLINDWLFVGWPADQACWHKLMDLDVVCGVLGYGGKPVWLSGSVISELMMLWGGGTLAPENHRYMRRNREYEEGDLVRVVAGPFNEFPATVVEISDKCVSALVNIFGREVKAEFKAWDLVAE